MSYLNQLKQAGVIDFCERAGLDFEKIFMPDKAFENDERYADAEFVVMDHPAEGLLGGQVVHLIPKNVENEKWEEWFQIDDTMTHRILTTKKGEVCIGEVTIELDDTCHPDQVKGKHWYYYDAEYATPIRF